MSKPPHKIPEIQPSELIDLIDNPIDGHKYKWIITQPSKGHFRLDIRLVYHNCFTCKNEHHINDLEIRQDSRLTNLYLPKKFCKSCVKVVDDILQRYKGNAIPRHLSKLA